MTETLDIKITKTNHSRLNETDFDNLPFGKTFSDHMFVADYADGKVSIFRPDKNAIRFNKSAERLCMPALPEEIFIQSIAAVVDIEIYVAGLFNGVCRGGV